MQRFYGGELAKKPKMKNLIAGEEKSYCRRGKILLPERSSRREGIGGASVRTYDNPNVISNLGKAWLINSDPFFFNPSPKSSYLPLPDTRFIMLQCSFSLDGNYQPPRSSMLAFGMRSSCENVNFRPPLPSAAFYEYATCNYQLDARFVNSIIKQFDLPPSTRRP